MIRISTKISRERENSKIGAYVVSKKVRTCCFWALQIGGVLYGKKTIQGIEEGNDCNKLVNNKFAPQLQQSLAVGTVQLYTCFS